MNEQDQTPTVLPMSTEAFLITVGLEFRNTYHDLLEQIQTRLETMAITQTGWHILQLSK